MIDSADFFSDDYSKDQMYLSQPTIKNGKIFGCSQTGAIYLIESGKKRHFPNETIYQSWGSPAFKYVSCTSLNQLPNGVDIPLLQDGSVVECATTGAIYLIDNHQKRHFPNPSIYQSWGSPPFKYVPCTLLDQLPTGVDIPLLQSNATLECPKTGAIYEIKDGRKHWYPDLAIYQSWGSPPAQTISCALLNLLPNGLKKPLNTNLITLFTQPHYKGKSFKIINPKNFTNATFLSGVHIDSIKVGSGVNIKLYAQPDYKGFIEEIFGPTAIPKLGHRKIGSIEIIQIGNVSDFEQISSNGYFWSIVLFLILLVLGFLYYRYQNKW